MSTTQTSTTSCALCGVATADGSEFCCAGCQTVYRILEAKGEVDGFEEHPLFRQALQAGLISNPDLLEQLRQRRAESEDGDVERLHLTIGEMWCPSCAEVIRLMLLQHKGIKSCVVDYATDLAAIEFAPKVLSREAVMAVIQRLGYTASLLEDATGRKVSRSLWVRFAVAAFCNTNIMMFSYPIYAAYFGDESGGLSYVFAYLSLFFAIPVVTYASMPIYRRFLNSLRVGLFGMETLVVIGVTTATALSVYELWRGSDQVYFDSMSALVTLVLLGKIIESKAKFSARETLFRLNRSLPRRGRKRMSDGSAQFVPVKEITVGDIIVINTGESIVLDGDVADGDGACDESLMTGESTPVPKSIGTRVLGGSILSSGSLEVRVARTAEASALQRVIQLVEPQLGHKAQYVRAVDPIVRWFVPVVLAIAAGVYLWTADPLRAVTLLLISCPCAIGIAAPLSESLLMQRLSQRGVLVRNRGVLRLLGNKQTVIFDKTGTLTEGRFKVLGGLGQLTTDERGILKALVSRSNHPIPQAISRALVADQAAGIGQVREIVGQGLQAGEYRLGSAPFVGQPEQHDSATTVHFARGSEVIATIRLGDALRADAAATARSLECILLSGDSESAVRAVANECGISEAYARITPLEKQAFVQKLRAQGKQVCVVGDGINDAPALSAANIGISVVSATDLSIQVSDLLLTSDKLGVLKEIAALGRRGRQILRQNLFWAFAYNVVGIGLAAAGLLTPFLAALAMVLSSLIVVANAWRT